MAKRNLADAPKYCLCSHQNDLNIAPVKLILEAGVITNRANLSSTLGADMEGTDTLLIKLPPDIGWDADAFSFMLVGDNIAGGGIVTGPPDLSTIRNDGTVRFPIADAYTGRIEGFVANTHVNPPGLGVRGSVDGDFSSAKANTAVRERNVYKTRSTVEDLFVVPLRFLGDGAGGVDPESLCGPIGYGVEKGAAVGEYILKMPFDVPDQLGWVVTGITDQGNVVATAGANAGLDDEVVIQIRAAGTPVDLVGTEQVRVLLMGQGTGVARRGRSGGGGENARENYVGRHPAWGLVRDPVFDPFDVTIGPTGNVGLGAGSWCPPGTAFKQRVPSGPDYDYNVGTVYNNPAATWNTWVTADVVQVATTALSFVDDSTIRNDAKLTFTFDAPLAPAPEGRLTGYAFLSGNKEQ